MGRHVEAEAEFREEVRTNPATYEAWESLVLLLAAEGRPDDVEKAIAELVGRVPGAESYLSAIRALSVVGDASGAARWQREGTKRFPEDVRLRSVARRGI